MYPLFLRMLRYYVQMDETRPNGGIVQVLDIPQNLDALGDLDAHVGGIQLPLYDGVHFCHAIFAPKALKAMKEYLDINLPPVRECDWSLKKFDTVPAFTKSRDFTTGTHADMEEDYVIFCQIKVGVFRALDVFCFLLTSMMDFLMRPRISMLAYPSVSNAFVKWLETGKHGGSRANKGEDASMVYHVQTCFPSPPFSSDGV